MQDLTLTDEFAGWTLQDWTMWDKVYVMLVCVQHWNQWYSHKGDMGAYMCSRHIVAIVSTVGDCSTAMHKTNAHR